MRHMMCMTSQGIHTSAMGQQDAACDARHVFDAATQMGAQGVKRVPELGGGGGRVFNSTAQQAANLTTVGFPYESPVWSVCLRC